MSTRFPEIFRALAAPFGDREVKTRTGAGGRSVSYVTAATVANRLDNVLGPESWDFSLSPWGADALIGTLTVRLPDGSMVSKSNVGGKADMPSEDDEAKSAASDCLKRCGTMLGIARYLYRDGVPTFVQERSAAGVELDVTPPPAPSKPPVVSQASRPPAANGHQPDAGGKPRHEWPNAAPKATATAEPPTRNGSGSVPRSGKALFGWVKEQEQRHGVGLLKYLNQWSKLQEFPGRMVDWDADQVALAHAEACRKLKSLESQENGE